MKYNFTAKHAKRGGAGAHQAKQGRHASRSRQKAQWRREH